MFLKWPTNTMVIQRFNASDLVALAGILPGKVEKRFILQDGAS